jgi:hypothetical protein
MTATTHAGMTGTIATPAEVGAKYIRWGLGLFVFGLVIGFFPLAHYMHGSFDQVQEPFLKNVTLWWGGVRGRWRSMSHSSAASP